LRVFVSSTLAELADERAAAREAIERLQLVPVMFELGARPHPPRELYRAYLEQSHIFVGIHWQRYGWVAPGETISGLEDEYLLSQGMPRLLYVKAPAEQREPGLDQLLKRNCARRCTAGLPSCMVTATAGRPCGARTGCWRPRTTAKSWCLRRS
jgi:hypothetical protein